MALSRDRPPVAGILAYSGFVPTVDGWEPHFDDRRNTRAFVAHGRRDPIMDIGFAHRARQLLEEGGLDVEYHESEVAHQIDPAHLGAASSWLAAAI